MSTSAPFFTATWKAGKFTCELSVLPMEPGKPAHCTINWTPHLPSKPLSGSAMREYRRGRDEAFAALMAKAGGCLSAVVEL